MKDPLGQQKGDRDGGRKGEATLGTTRPRGPGPGRALISLRRVTPHCAPLPRRPADARATV